MWSTLAWRNLKVTIVRRLLRNHLLVFDFFQDLEAGQIHERRRKLIVPFTAFFSRFRFDDLLRLYHHLCDVIRRNEHVVAYLIRHKLTAAVLVKRHIVGLALSARAAVECENIAARWLTNTRGTMLLTQLFSVFNFLIGYFMLYFDFGLGRIVLHIRLWLWRRLFFLM